MIGKKIAGNWEIGKLKPVCDMNSTNVEKKPSYSTNYYTIDYHKIPKLLNDSTVSKFLVRKWIEVNDLLNGPYIANKNIKFKTPICDYTCVIIVMHILL